MTSEFVYLIIAMVAFPLGWCLGKRKLKDTTNKLYHALLVVEKHHLESEYINNLNSSLTLENFAYIKSDATYDSGRGYHGD